MIWGTLVFLFAERAALSDYWAKHGSNLSAALRDALPLIEQYRSRVAPTNETVKHVEAVVRKATEPTWPQPAQGDPENWNPNAG